MSTLAAAAGAAPPRNGSSVSFPSAAARAWAIVTLVLAILFLPMTGAGLFQLADSPINATGRGTVYAVLTVLQFAIAVAFLDGSIGVLKGRGWGRWTLAGAAACALPVIAASAVLAVLLHGDPAFAKAMTDQIVQKAPQMAAMPPETLKQAVNMQTAIVFVGGLFMAAVEAAFCLLLWRQMTVGERAANR